MAKEAAVSAANLSDQTEVGRVVSVCVDETGSKCDSIWYSLIKLAGGDAWVDSLNDFLGDFGSVNMLRNTTKGRRGCASL